MAGRIYVVNPKGEVEKVCLVRAQSKAGALRYAAEKTMTAAVASQDELVALVAKGVAVEDATAKVWA